MQTVTMALLVAIAVSGCATEKLDVAQSHLNQEFARSGKRAIEFLRAYRAVADEMAKNKHDMQAAFAERILDDWLDDHSYPDGSLFVYELDGNGEIRRDPDGKPLTRAATKHDVQGIMEDANELRTRLIQSQTSWRVENEKFDLAVSAYEQAIEEFARDDLTLLEKRQRLNEADQRLLGAFQALLGAAGGVAVGAGL